MLRSLLLVVAVVPLAAAAPAAPPTGPQDVATDMLASLELDHAVTVQGTGAEPRVVLRYRPKPGAVATIETVSRTDLDLSMTGPDGQAMSMPMGAAMPSIVVKSRNSVGQPTPNGLVPVKIEQLGTRLEGAVAPEMEQAMRAGLAGMDGMAFQLLLDANGDAVQLDVVGGADPAMAEMLQQVMDALIGRTMVSFPDEPLGVGAKWTTDIDMTMSGLDLSIAQTMTVRSISTEAVDLDLALKLGLGDGGLQIPGMPPELKPEITRFVGTGGGAMHVDLTTLASTGTMSMDMDIGMKMNMVGQPPMAMGMKMKQATETRAAR